MEVVPDGRNLTIAVVGDFRCDSNYIGNHLGFSHENEALPIFNVTEVTYNPGGAANLAADLAVYGCHVIAIGVVGIDTDGDRLIELLRNLGVDTNYLVRFGTTGYFSKQYFPSGMHVGRHNLQASVPTDEVGDLVTHQFNSIVDTLDGVVVADYDEVGSDILSIIDIDIGSISVSTFGLSRNDIRQLVGCNYLICNTKELLLHTETNDPEVAKSSLGWDPILVVTQEGRGVLISNSLSTIPVPSLPLHETIDPCGAGDGFAAGFIVSILAGMSELDSGRIGNSMARWICKQLHGVGAYPTIDDIMNEYGIIYHDTGVRIDLGNIYTTRVDGDHNWGEEYWLANCDDGNYGAKILKFHTGWIGSTHYHVNKDEILIPMDGNIIIRLWDNDINIIEHPLEVGHQMRIKPGEPHAIVNTSGSTVHILEISNFEDEETIKTELSRRAE